jgi:hypothetical protein
MEKLKMRSDSKFKMPKGVRGLLATGSKESRDTFRQNMVEATLQSLIKPEKEKKTK